MMQTAAKYTIRRAAALLVAAAMTFSMTACGTRPVAMVSMTDLGRALLDADPDFPDMSSADSSAENAADIFTYLSDMDYDKVEGYFMGYSSEGKADEVAVICVKEASDVQEAVDSLNAHVEGRVSLYTTYAPDQVDRAEAAQVFSQGRYAVLIISVNADAVKTAFTDFVTNDQ